MYRICETVQMTPQGRYLYIPYLFAILPAFISYVSASGIPVELIVLLPKPWDSLASDTTTQSADLTLTYFLAELTSV